MTLRNWALVLALVVGCDDPVDDLDPPVVDGAEAMRVYAPTGAPEANAPLRIRHHRVRSFIDDAAQIEVRQFGLVIDVGTPDQHKFLPPWQPGKIGEVSREGARASAEIDAGVEFKVDVRQHPVSTILVRAAASRGRQILKVYVDGAYAGRETLTTEWSTARFDLKKPMRPGFHDVRLVLYGGARHRMKLDWVYLRADEKDAPLVPLLDKVALRNHGDPMRALVGDPPRTYSLWTEVPPDTSLIFDYAGADTDFKVSILTDRGVKASSAMAFEGSGTATYQEAEIDLSPWANEFVRIEFTTRGRGEASWGEPWIAKPGRPPQRQASADRPRGLIVLVIDTIRQDRFRVFNPKSRVDTPAYTALAKEALVFDNAYTTAPWTKPSVATMLTGLYPSTHGAQSEVAKLSDRIELLPEILRANGFATALFSANGYVSDYFGFVRGWDEYVNFPRLKERTQADNVYDRALAWLRNRPPDQRFFLYLQTVDPHVPYQTPGRFLSMYVDKAYDGWLGSAVSGTELEAFNEGQQEMSAEDRDYLIAMYDAEITYHDAYMGRFIDALKKDDMLDDVLLVVTNDHGEELFDHGKLDHGQSLYDELIRSPMLMRHPGSIPAGRYTAPASIIDITPTALDALGLEPGPQMQGRSLLAAAQGAQPPAPAYAIAQRSDEQRAIRFGPYKLIVSKDGKRELYDLRVDPRETKDLSRYRPVALRACETHLFEGLRIPRALERPNGMANQVRYEADTAKIDKVLMEHLQALGYFND